MMGERKTDKDAYLWLATSKIPGRLEQKRVREELEDHIEELAADIRAQGVDRDRAVLRAVKQMGDAQELAESLGKIHSYDTAGAFRRMVNLLWIGFFFSTIQIQIGPAFMYRPIQVAAQILFLYAFFRLKTLDPALKKGFLWAIFCFLLTYLQDAVNALMWENVRNVSGNLLSFLCLAAHIVTAWYFIKGLCAVAVKRFTLIKACFWLEILFDAALGASMISRIGKNGLLSAADAAWNYHFDGILQTMVFFMILAAFLIISLLIRSALTANEDAGVGPCKKRKACLLFSILLVILILPVGASVMTALLPVKTEESSIRSAENETDMQERQALLSRLLETSEDKELARRVTQLLPREEIPGLLAAKKVWIESCEEEGNSSALIVSLKPLEKISDAYCCHIGFLSNLQRPFSGYAAACSLWVDLDDPGEETLIDPLAAPPEACGHWFFFEKGGRLYEFHPRKCADTGTSEMNVSEYSIPRNADNVYIYQTVTINAAKPIGDSSSWLMAGHETVIQKSPVRLPYDQVIYDTSQPSWFSLTSIPLPDGGNRILFTRGTVRHNESFTWKRDGSWHYIHFEPDAGSE